MTIDPLAAIHAYLCLSTEYARYKSTRHEAVHRSVTDYLRFISTCAIVTRTFFHREIVRPSLDRLAQRFEIEITAMHPRVLFARFLRYTHGDSFKRFQIDRCRLQSLRSINVKVTVRIRLIVSRRNRKNPKILQTTSRYTVKPETNHRTRNMQESTEPLVESTRGFEKLWI